MRCGEYSRKDPKQRKGTGRFFAFEGMEKAAMIFEN